MRQPGKTGARGRGWRREGGTGEVISRGGGCRRWSKAGRGREAL